MLMAASCDRIEASRTGNIFSEISLLIARLDKMARNEELQEKLAQVESWNISYKSLTAIIKGTHGKFTSRFSGNSTISSF